MTVPRSILAFALAGAVSPGAMAQYTEVEPNDSKAQANPVALPAGSPITGNSTSAAGAGFDYFKVSTAPAFIAIYRHRLVITTAGAAGHIGAIHGLGQSAGIITAASDITMQQTTTNTTPARMSQWYGFGKGESIYYVVSGAASTTSDYTSTYDAAPVAVQNLGSFAPGSIVITTLGQGHMTDTDLLVFDGTLNPIAGFLNDDTLGPPTSLQSTLARTFPAGFYFLALSTWNLCDNRPSPADDNNRGSNVLDFPGAVAAATLASNVPLNFAVIDSAGTHPFPATRPASYDVLWFRFTVGSTSPECYTRAAPPVAGRFVRGGPNGVPDSAECVGDWDRDHALTPGDVAAFISTWFFSLQNPGNLDADIDCNGQATPADVATFIQLWFGGIQNPSSLGCP